jgi:hypothetical protein
MHWYHSKNVSFSAYNNLVSRIGEHWFGEQSKNLYINFDDSKGGELPIGDSRMVSMNVTEPGDYYFEARSEDYAYRAVSEKVVISEDKEYNVYLDIVPSNPAVRIKAYEYESGSPLTGNGSIKLYYEEDRCEYGECTHNEWLYDQRDFSDSEEMNALFFLYTPYDFESRNYWYKAVVERDGYIGQEQYVWTGSKYSENSFYLEKNAPTERGNLTVNIVPGKGTSIEDVERMEGTKLMACQNSHPYVCGESIVSNSSAYFENILYGNYSIYGSADSIDANQSPLNIQNTYAEVSDVNSVVQAKALLGYRFLISLLSANGVLLEPADVPIVGECIYYQGENTGCYNPDPPYVLSQNPWDVWGYFSSEANIDESAQVEYILTFRNGGVDKNFSLTMEQGYHVKNWVFDSNSASDDSTD